MFKKFVLPAILVVLGGLLVLPALPSMRSQVTVVNESGGALKEVVVGVRGHSYMLGALPPGQSRTTAVAPAGESHVELTFVDEADQPHSWSGGYMDADHYTMRLTIKPRGGVTADSSIRAIP